MRRWQAAVAVSLGWCALAAAPPPADPRPESALPDDASPVQIAGFAIGLARGCQVQTARAAELHDRLNAALERVSHPSRSAAVSRDVVAGLTGGERIGRTLGAGCATAVPRLLTRAEQDVRDLVHR